MSAKGFRSVFMVGAVASAALGCYLISLRVASERAALEGVETKIVLAQRDIRLLETEIGTRGRLAQLERWNVRAIQLSAPTADQFVDSGFQLATMVKPDPRPVIDAPVVMAAAPREVTPSEPRLTDDSDTPTSRAPSEMMHVASFTRPSPTVVTQRAPAPAEAKPKLRAPLAATAPAKAATKPVKTATADPLAPLPTGSATAKSGGSPRRATKHTGTP